jgi:uncharacterized protein YndB with AHSA1/START domain
MIPDAIERDTLIHAPPARVWSALTEARHLGSWFGDAGAEIDLKPGGRLRVDWKEHGIALGVIEELDFPRTFSFRWSLISDEPPRPGNSTHVRFTLEAEGEGHTRLRVVESGFRSLDGDAAERRRHLDANTAGWKAELEELRAYLAPLPA